MFAAAAKNFVAPGLYIVGRHQAVEDQIERQTETLARDPRHTNWRGSQVYQLEPYGAGALGVMPKLKTPRLSMASKLLSLRKSNMNQSWYLAFMSVAQPLLPG